MTQDTGAADVRWNLAILYDGIDDPRIEADAKSYESSCARFSAEHKGHLATRLGDAIRAYAMLVELGSKIDVYHQLVYVLDTGDEAVRTQMADMDQRLDMARGDHLAFFDIELADLPQDAIDAQAAADETVRTHLPWIRDIRAGKEHQLPEAVESALMKRAANGAVGWATFFEEVMTDLGLTELLERLSVEQDADERAALLKSIHDALDGFALKYAARTLNAVVREKSIEDAERKYAHPLDERNKESGIPDEVVDALHAAVRDVAGPITRRYYQAKAKLLGLGTLRWSDRRAPLPFKDTTVIPWSEAVRMVTAAYERFSPTLADLVRRQIDGGFVDAPFTPTKSMGVFNQPLYLADRGAMAFTFLQYLGTSADVMTLAHELGHGVHHLLAGEAQGALMMEAPVAYSETASVFGEQLAFEHLSRHVGEAGGTKPLLALIGEKIDDMLDTMVRQIGLSEFERAVHGADGEQTVEELHEHWMRSLYALYGQPGDVFTYEHAERLWAYIPHFHDPFYVYAYAFGELLTQSLFVARAQLGDRFEQLYLDMLRSGGTRDVEELLAPFGLDASSPTFWADGIRASLGALVERYERMTEEILASGE